MTRDTRLESYDVLYLNIVCLFLMNIKGVFPRELSLAELTLKLISVVVVNLHMSLQIAFSSESLVTNMAVEPLLTSVKHRLNTQSRMQ